MIHSGAMSPASALATLALGWSLVAWSASAALARRRGLTMLAAVLDPRSWSAEKVMGVRARVLLVAWALGCLAAALAAGRGAT